MSDFVRPHRRQPTRLCLPWASPGKNTRVGCHFLLQCMKVKSESEVTQSCPTLSDPMDCSPPGSSIHGIFQPRVLEWVAIAFSISRASHTQRISLSNIFTLPELHIFNQSTQKPKKMHLFYVSALSVSPVQPWKNRHVPVTCGWYSTFFFYIGSTLFHFTLVFPHSTPIR